MKSIIKISTAVLFIFALISFAQNQDDNDYIIDNQRVGNIELCDSLSKVCKLYKNIKDSIFVGDEDVTWIGKEILLSENEWIIVEASWIDSTRIWRITTNSPKYRTKNGYGVGDKMSKLKQSQNEISYFDEGLSGFSLKSNSVNFMFSIENNFTNDFYEKISNYCLDYKKFINDSASITSITIGEGCSN